MVVAKPINTKINTLLKLKLQEIGWLYATRVSLQQVKEIFFEGK